MRNFLLLVSLSLAFLFAPAQTVDSYVNYMNSQNGDQANSASIRTTPPTTGVVMETQYLGDFNSKDDQCNIVFDLFDSYGDGWSGCGINVKVGGTIIQNVTLAAGSQGTVEVMTPVGQVEFEWVEGSWSYDCSFDIYDAYGIPIFSADAPPGAGLFFTWENTCVAPESVTVSGNVTVASTGEAVQNAVVAYSGVVDTTVTTAADGSYTLEVYKDYTYNVSVEAEGYNSFTEENEITEETIIDYALTAPVLEVDVTDFDVTTTFLQNVTEDFVITNTGDGPLTYSMEVDLDETSKTAWDLLAEITLNGSGEQGIATDGEYLYTTSWNGSPGYDFGKYELDGTFIEGFSIEGATGIRDLSYDGDFFYGGNSSNKLFKMDFETQELVETISTDVPAIRHCAYYPGEDCFFLGDWGDLYKVDRTGSIVQTCALPNSAYGSEVDMASDIGPCLYIYSQLTGATTTIVQYDIANDVYTDFEFQVFPEAPDALAGGLFIGEYAGKIAIFTNSQVEPNKVKIYELRTAGWLQFDPASGVILPGESQTVTALFNASWTDEGVLTATAIVETKRPNVGVHEIPTVFTINAPTCEAPTNLTATTDAANLTLNWLAPGETAPSWPEGFEGYQSYEDPAGWIIIDSDGDGHQWAVYNTNQYDFVVPHEGESVISSRSWNGEPLSPDNYLITPSLTGATNITYYVCSNYSYSSEHYAVMASSTGTEIEDFDIVFEETLTGIDKGQAAPKTDRAVQDQTDWFLRDIELPEGTKYVAFRHYACYNYDFIFIDDIDAVGAKNTKGITYNIYKESDLIKPIVEGVEGTSYTFTDLAEAEYCYAVRAVHEDGCVSLTTNIACATVVTSVNVFGTVTTPNGAGIADVKVSFDGEHVTTNAAGEYEIVVQGGTYDVTFSKFGYEEYTETEFVVEGDQVELNATLSPICNPVQNLVAENDGSNVITINWDAPAGFGQGETAELAWWTGVFAGNSIGTGAAADFEVANKFEPADYEGYEGWKLVNVQFVPSEANCEYSIRAWVGDNMILDQEIPNENIILNDFTAVDIETNVTIEEGQDFYVGYRCNTQTGFPAGCDEGPAVVSKGDLVKLGSDQWEFISDMGLDYNFVIIATVEGARGERANIVLNDNRKISNAKLDVTKTELTKEVMPVRNDRTLQGYKVFVDGNELAVIDNPEITTFIDLETFTKQDAEYCVVALYEACESEEACTTVNIITGIEDNNGISVYPNPAKDIVVIEGVNVEIVQVYNNIGQLVKEVKESNVSVADLGTGMYLFNIISVDGTQSQVKVFVY